MNQTLLTENSWKTVAVKFKVKDNGLQRALAAYEKLADDKYAEQLKALAAVSLLASNLKKVKEVAALPVVLKYLADVVSAATAEQREVSLQAKTAADTKTKSMEIQQDVTVNKAKAADLAFQKMNGYIKG